MIKAIETQYKGYRFRSRLEARWAVFFDKLGIEWEYELEGFDLGEHGKYLPDFHLVKPDIYLEIKPRSKTRVGGEKIYLAGKFPAYDENWRADLVDGEIAYSCETNYRNSKETRWLLGGNYFVGPYGLDEITGGHGVGFGHITTDVVIDERHGAFVVDGAESASPKEQSMVFDTCKGQIFGCDVLFAWINTNDCYGTIAEIGYAYALGKKIWIGFSSEELAREMWFVGKMSDRLCVAGNARIAFLCFCRGLQEQEKKCAALSMKFWEKGTWLIDGEPGSDSHRVSVFKHGDKYAYGVLGFRRSFWGPELEVLEQGYIYSKFANELEGAVLAARSARFEYGETP